MNDQTGRMCMPEEEKNCLEDIFLEFMNIGYCPRLSRQDCTIMLFSRASRGRLSQPPISVSFFMKM